MILAKIFTGYTCFFLSTSGLPCPGCGLSRAFESLLRGDLRAAFDYHPLFWAAPAVIAACAYVLYKGHYKSPVRLRVFVRACLAVFIAVYALRMILLFPHTPPMVFNPRAFGPRTVTFIAGLLR